MKTNLIFKRQTNIDGAVKVVTRIIPIDIPMIDSGEGWILSGHTDIIETCEGVHIGKLLPISATNSSSDQLCIDASLETSDAQQPIETEDNNAKSTPKDVTKFESDVHGTAKLVRVKGVIKIVARKGKSTYNQTTPNSVCIDDTTKVNFFKSCRGKFGSGSSIFEFRPSDGTYYDYWDNVIDKEYQRQKTIFINKELSK